MEKKRPSYPSTKNTFTIANITKGKTILFFNINLFNLNGRFDVDIIFEDSQRNFLSSFNWLLLYFIFQSKDLVVYIQAPARRNKLGNLLICSILRSNLILVFALVTQSLTHSLTIFYQMKLKTSLSVQCVAAEIEYSSQILQSCSKLRWSFRHSVSFQCLFKLRN